MPDEADQRTLEELAIASARETHRDLYNPAQYIHDRLLDGEYQKQLRDRNEAELAFKYAFVAVRDCEIEAAAAHPGDPPKPSSLALPAAAVIAMMITVAPTLHDFVFVMADEFSSWFLSLLSGLFLGLLITLMILGDSEASEQRTAANWVGLSAGLFVSLALGALRIKGAQDAGDYILAAAMTALELGIVIGLEGIAIRRRKINHSWASRKLAADRAAAKLEAATLHLERSTQRLNQINSAIQAHINYVEERCFRFQHIDEIVAASVQAVRDGYRAGIAANRGRVLNPERRQL